MKVSQERAELPLTLSDVLEFRSREVLIGIEIYENSTVAFLEADDDFFAEGRTIKEAKENLVKSLEDELSFLDKHRDELGAELQEKQQRLEAVLR